MKLGLDIGSTTIKYAVLNDRDELVDSNYERHYSHIAEKCLDTLIRLEKKYSGERFTAAVSGSAGMGLAERCGIPFVQEVYAERVAAEKLNPGTDCAIELGGEDAKILFLSNGLEVRMNGSCAGGTGAFIDQMAVLLKTEPDEMDRLALKAKRTYTIASRCGVFAKSDIQPLINQGAEIPDVAASIYQAVVNQTIAGLAQGRQIKGNILYLGGPLTFSQCLRRTFDQTLHLKGICPENSLYYVALGAAYYADTEISLTDVIAGLSDNDHIARYASLSPLFENRDEYWKFHLRHAKANVRRVKFDENTGPVHIGIDAGSTTVKIIVMNDRKEILLSEYRSNDGDPLTIVKETLMKMHREHPYVQVASATATGYGEQFISHAFHCDYSLVETVAHYTAAKHFMPDVDFIIDIGGQDMKCFKIENGAISDIYLNEACSSGCGSFLQTFAEAMDMTAEDFAMQGLFAKHPVDLGSRCTVFMNSSVKQAQKDGASLEAISAGLSMSIVKNALYKVIRVSSPEELGRNIVVQGGTFYNEAVLRAFEKEIGRYVVRPDIAGLMGAYGAALYGKSRSRKESTSSILNLKGLEVFSNEVRNTVCQGCGNHCQLTVNRFAEGSVYISGNRCEKPVTGKKSAEERSLYAFKRKKIQEYADRHAENPVGTIGIPRCLNMYELLPFWHTLFETLGFDVIVSPESDRTMYQNGQSTIPSDTVCFPAKLTHGHIDWLAKQNVDAIFYPCMSYNMDEGLGDNHYNCPVVAYYPEVLANNCFELNSQVFIYDYVNPERRKDFTKRFPKILQTYFPQVKNCRKAIDAAYEEYENYMHVIREEGMRMIKRAEEEGRHVIVLAGRPYHVDPEVSHGIDGLIARNGAYVITEDSISHLEEKFPVSVLNQWTYHSRLYAAARYCTEHDNLDLVQLVSFGCGLDAITTDETKEILQRKGKLYTQLKIDEITNLGAVNIRIRSLFAALEEKGRNDEH